MPSDPTAMQWREAALALRDHAARFERCAEEAEHLDRAKDLPGPIETLEEISRTAPGHCQSDLEIDWNEKARHAVKAWRIETGSVQ